MKKLMIMLVSILICAMVLTGCGGPKRGHVKIGFDDRTHIEYDYVEIDGELIKYNEVVVTPR